jgi:hypothetical protein
MERKKPASVPCPWDPEDDRAQLQPDSSYYCGECNERFTLDELDENGRLP